MRLDAAEYCGEGGFRRWTQTALRRAEGLERSRKGSSLRRTSDSGDGKPPVVFSVKSVSRIYRMGEVDVLEAPDRTFYVFKLVDGRLKRQAVTLGLRSDLELEVTGGLSENDSIVARPDTTMTDGMRVAVKPPTE